MEERVTVITKQQLSENKVRQFSIENRLGQEVGVFMHPKCFLKMTQTGSPSGCNHCLVGVLAALER